MSVGMVRKLSVSGFHALLEMIIDFLLRINGSMRPGMEASIQYTAGETAAQVTKPEATYLRAGPS